jgi:hypothetical protein
MHTITVTELAAILGMVLGTAGFVMGLMNYLRDRPKIKVGLNWNMVDSRTDEKFGMFIVSNIGRRPIFISAAVMTVPRTFKPNDFFLMESIQGRKLSEGDAPAKFRIRSEGMEQYAEVWRDVRVYVEDSAGRKYFAKKLRKSRIPPWAKWKRPESPTHAM